MQVNRMGNNDAKPTVPEGNATKECKYCKMQIPAQAKVCPFCRKRLRGRGVRIVLGSIAGVFALLIVLIIASSGSGSSERAVDNSASSQQNQLALPASTQTTEIQQERDETPSPDSTTASATQSDNKLTWPVAYVAQVLLSDQQYGDNAKYDLIYFDEDEIPELLISARGYWTTMYAFSDGEILCPMDQWAYGAMGNTGYSYLPSQNKLYNQNADYAGALRHLTIMSLNDAHELETRVSIDARMFDDKNGNGTPDNDEYFDDDAVEYYLDGRKISEAEVSAYIDGDYRFMAGAFSCEQILAILNNSSYVNENSLREVRWKLVYHDYIEEKFPSENVFLTETKFYPFDANNDGIPELYCETQTDDAGSIICMFSGSSIESYRIPMLNQITQQDGNLLGDTIFYIPGTGKIWACGWDDLTDALVLDYLLISNNSIQAIGISEQYSDENGNTYNAKFKWKYEDVDYDTYMANMSAAVPSDGTSRSIKSNFKAYDRAGILKYFS